MPSRVSAIIVAAGEGRRFGGPKQAVLLGRRPVLEWSLASFQDHSEVDEIFLVIRDMGDAERYRGRFPKLSEITLGGVRRQDSVKAGFSLLNSDRTDIVLIHDGARPLVGKALITRIIRAAQEFGAAVPVIPVQDTLKKVMNRFVMETVDRNQLVRVQTPQGFRLSVLRDALARSEAGRWEATDEAAFAERAGHQVAAVDGDPNNLKITTTADLKMAEALIGN